MEMPQHYEPRDEDRGPYPPPSRMLHLALRLRSLNRHLLFPSYGLSIAHGVRISTDKSRVPDLPVEVWEHVIDLLPVGVEARRDWDAWSHPVLCQGDRHWDNWSRPSYLGEYGCALRACSLTCRAWLPRSRRNLYGYVLIRSADSLAKFLGAITTHPFLADFTRSLCVNAVPQFELGRRVYIGFARADIGRKLRNLQTLSIFGMDGLLFPPGLLQTVSLHYPHIRELAIRTTSIQIVNTLRLIWNLSYLDSLELNVREEAAGGLVWPDDKTVQFVSAYAKRRSGRSSLRKLFFKTQTHTPTLPPRLPHLLSTLGNKLTEIQFSFTLADLIDPWKDNGSVGLAKYLSSLCNLERLSFQSCYLDRVGDIGCMYDFLSCMQLPPFLHTLHCEMQWMDLRDASNTEDRLRYRRDISIHILRQLRNTHVGRSIADSRSPLQHITFVFATRSHLGRTGDILLYPRDEEAEAEARGFFPHINATISVFSAFH